MRVYVDRDVGNTRQSLKYLEKILKRHPRLQVISIIIDRLRTYSFEVHARDGDSGEDIFILLSGLNCGYWGTGPHGSVRALRMLGFDWMTLEQSVFSNDIIVYHRDIGWRYRRFDVAQEVDPK